MPETKAKKTPTKAVKAKPKKVEQVELPFPDLEVLHCWAEGVDGGIGPITEEQMKEILGWETEGEYRKRKMDEDDSLLAEQAVFTDEDWGRMSLKNRAGEKVVCWNCRNNRELDMAQTKEYIQDILRGNWAGPTPMPGTTINGETIIIGKSGQTISCQKRGVALVLACEDWRRNPESYPAWPDGPPVMDALVVRGVSEDPRVIRTVDNVQPRDLYDVFYSSDEFEGESPAAKRLLSNMMAKAVDVLWERTRAGDAKGKQTHSESIEFDKAHPKLKKLVRHVFEENKDNTISVLRVSPGMVAAMTYLMASSTTDIDGGYLEERNEKKLKFDFEAKAKLFVTEWLAKTSGKNAIVLRKAFALAAGDDQPDSSSRRQIAILAKAWHIYREGGQLSPKEDDQEVPIECKEGGQLYLEYQVGPDGIKHLKPDPLHSVGGVDQGIGKYWNPPEPEPTEEEKAAIAARKKAEAARKDAERLAAGKGDTAAGEALKKQLAELHDVHPGRILLFHVGEHYSIWEANAHVAARVLDGPSWAKAKKQKNGLDGVKVPAADLDASVKKLWAGGYKVAVVEVGEGGKSEVKVIDDPNPPKPKIEPAKPKASPVKQGAPKTAPKAAPKPAKAEANGDKDDAPWGRGPDGRPNIDRYHDADGKPIADVNGTPLQTTVKKRPPVPLKGGLN